MERIVAGSVHEVKHGVKLHLYNLCKDGLGDPTVPTKIRGVTKPPAPKWEPPGPPPAPKATEVPSAPGAAKPTSAAKAPAAAPAVKKGEGGDRAWIWLGTILALAIGGGGFLGYRYYANPAATVTPAPISQAPNPDSARKPSAVGTPVETPAPVANTAPATPPETPPATPASQTSEIYSGPSNGLVLWSGLLPKNDIVTVDGATTSVGRILSGSLPGVPVNLTLDPKDITLVDPPSAANGWKHFSFHAKKGRRTVVTIHWAAR